MAKYPLNTIRIEIEYYVTFIKSSVTIAHHPHHYRKKGIMAPYKISIKYRSGDGFSEKQQDARKKLMKGVMYFGNKVCQKHD